ncbi:hypothetical protein GQR58_022067 [Nymphon striatum]|nr:hypothetical protein GQR58_022067 [Nymphon striatum]
MKANPDKFQALAIGKKTWSQNISFQIDDISIPCEESVKLLGVDIDFKLSFDIHIKTIYVFYHLYHLGRCIDRLLTLVSRASRRAQHHPMCTFTNFLSHVGKSGDETADFAAKSALSLPVEPQSIYFHDFYMYISTHILSIGQSKWDGEINKLHAIKPKLGEWALAYRKSRKEESILCRLRVGHTYLTHSFLLRNEAQPVCGRCQQPLTVRHVLVDCVALTSVRSRFYSPLPWEEFFEEVDICK